MPVAGASEYRDVLSAVRYLASRADVDPDRIGIWGGSYGGYLTALALARNSDLFAAGVDIHGVHDWIAAYGDAFPSMEARYEKPADLKEALDVAWKSSPVADIATWRSSPRKNPLKRRRSPMPTAGTTPPPHGTEIARY